MHLLTQSALLQALGWTLMNSLWQMGLLWLSWWLLTLLFQQAPSRFRHGLALALLAFGTFGSLVTFIATYFFDGGGWATLRADSWGNTNRLIATALPYCSVLYLLVLGVLLTRYCRQVLHARRLTREGLSKMPAGLRVFVESTSRLMGIGRVVRAWLSDRVDVPMTLGFLKPVILLPAAMVSNLSTQQVEAILVHELAHIRRRDYLLNLGISTIGLLFFFNPFSRLLIRQLQKEREHCCDDEVLQFRYDPHAYVSALLSLARQHRQGRVALAATGEGGEQLLLQRARKILQQKRTDRRPGARPFILLFLTAAITVFGLSLPSKPHGATARSRYPSATPGRSAAMVLAANGQFRSSGAVYRKGIALAPETSATAPLKGELVFIPIVNTGAPIHHDDTRTDAAVASATPHASPKPAVARRAKSDQDDGEEADGPALMGTLASNSESQTAGSGQQSEAYLTQPATLTITAPSADRDNSLGRSEEDQAEAAKAPDLPPTENLVFVPNSSFSWQKIDTARPEDKLSFLEQATEKEIRAQVEKLQKELQLQLEVLRRQDAQARALSSSTQQEIKKVLNQQIILQRDYLRKLDELHSRLKKTGRRLTTVYI